MAIKRPTPFLPIYPLFGVDSDISYLGTGHGSGAEERRGQGQGPGGRARLAFSWPLSPGASA